MKRMTIPIHHTAERLAAMRCEAEYSRGFRNGAFIASVPWVAFFAILLIKTLSE